MKGRTIRLYLVDGAPTGILTAEIINWTGKVIVAPRSQLSELLGMNFLLPRPGYDQSGSRAVPDSPRFVMKEGEKQAVAIESDGEFVVLAGSPARKQGIPSWTSYRGQRDELVRANKLIDSDDPAYYVFAENIGFASPSAAAAVVAAGNRNGRTYWRVEGANQTYAEWQESKLAAVEPRPIAEEEG